MKISFFQMLPSIAMRVKALQPRSELHDEEESNETCLHRLLGEKKERGRSKKTPAVHVLCICSILLSSHCPAAQPLFQAKRRKLKSAR